MVKTKLIAAGLSAALVMGALCGCSASNADKQTESVGGSESTQTSEVVVDGKAAKDDSSEQNQAVDQDAKANSTEDAAEESASSEQVSSEGDNSGVAEESVVSGETGEITIPAAFAENITQENLDEMVADGDCQAAVVNDDGSVTFTVTQEQRDEYVTELKSAIQQGLDSLVGSEGISSFVQIDTNDDYTNYVVSVSTEEVGMEEAMSVLAFAMYSGLYNAFVGNEIDNVHIEFVNADTGEVLESVDTKDMGDTE